MNSTLCRVAAWVIVVMGASASAVQAQSDQADRVRESTTVLGEIMAAPDSAIPRSVLEKAEAIAVFPSTIRAGFLIGGQRGKGIISVRDPARGGWSAPAFLTLTGGSIGAQIGGESVDIVLVVMNRRGVEHLLQNQFKIGGGASVSAGPVGRTAEASTDLQLRAEILSYSRSRGLFAGITLKGSAIRRDADSNLAFYRRPFRTREIVLDGKVPATGLPESAAHWRSSLATYATSR